MIILKINRRKNERETLEEIARWIEQGQVGIFPTDTVYGFIADAANKKAVEKVFRIKARARNNPLPVFVENIAAAKKIARISKDQEQLLKKRWPGRASFILKRKKSPRPLHGTNKDTIALRVPKFSQLNFILAIIDRPLVQTSANISGFPSSGVFKTTLNRFLEKKTQIDFAVDGGKLLGRPSTIIDLTLKPYRVLRP